MAHVSGLAALIPFLPLLGCALAGVCACLKVRSKLPAWIAVACLAGSFALTLQMFLGLNGGGFMPGGHGGGAGEGGGYAVVKAFDWINFKWGAGGGAAGVGGAGQAFVANFSFYLDSLTCLWMLFVTGLATLIALYASEYMAGDVGPGYCRFFAAFCLFVFSMACLVMGDNLVLLYLGWEGVGLCSYLLIGYFYTRPAAVAAAKKAFIVNRIGDLGLALGVWLTYVQFGTVEYGRLFPAFRPYIEAGLEGRFADVPYLVQLIPVLFTVGAFGKSAQVPLYVWLPDAMEGPTPVSALIHAATMVTAGVYLVARFLPLYVASAWALPIVAWGGTVTALLAATIGMAQFDIKRIMAYSTVSQLGYMFAGLGVVSAAAAEGAVGAPFHVFTHAFFKAMLFLACGAVMHGFGGQLDLRKLSGVMRLPGWRITGVAMLVGCLNLAGFPFTAGFFSKDMILASAFANEGTRVMGWVLLATAGLTAYYTFRVFFRVFVGPVEFEPGDEAHGHGGGHGAGHAAGHGSSEQERAEHGHPAGPEASHVKAEAALADRGAGHEGHGRDGHATAGWHAADGGHGAGAGHGAFHPHAPGWAVNAVLGTLAVAALLAVFAYWPSGWIGHMVEGSTTGEVVRAGEELHHAGGPGHGRAAFFGQDPYSGIMYWVSGAVGLVGIAVAYFLHLAGRTTAAASRADSLLPAVGPLAPWAQRKWYVDELYHAAFVLPLRVLSHVLHLIDKLIVDGLVNAFGWVPRAAGRGARRSQTGVLHDYALRMATGIGLVLIIVLVVLL